MNHICVDSKRPNITTTDLLVHNKANTIFFVLRGHRKGTTESFLNKKGYNKVKQNFFALCTQRKGIMQSFPSQKGYNKLEQSEKIVAKKNNYRFSETKKD